MVVAEMELTVGRGGAGNPDIFLKRIRLVETLKIDGNLNLWLGNLQQLFDKTMGCNTRH